MLIHFLPNNKNLDYSHLSQKMEGYSGSDIKLVCKEAAMKPLRRILEEIEKMEDDPKFKSINYNESKRFKQLHQDQ